MGNSDFFSISFFIFVTPKCFSRSAPPLIRNPGSAPGVQIVFNVHNQVKLKILTVNPFLNIF